MSKTVKFVRVNIDYFNKKYPGKNELVWDNITSIVYEVEEESERFYILKKGRCDTRQIAVLKKEYEEVTVTKI